MNNFFKSKVTLVLLGIILVLILVIVFLGRGLASAKQEAERYSSNQSALLSEVHHYKTSDSLNAASVKLLTLQNNELRDWMSAELEHIKTLETKNRDLTQLVKTVANSSAHVETYIRDSIITLYDSITVPVKRFDYSDNYLKLYGSIEGSTFKGDIYLTDTIRIVETVKRKRFLGFLWKIKKVKDTKYDIKTSSPYTQFSDFSVVKVIY